MRSFLSLLSFCNKLHFGSLMEIFGSNAARVALAFSRHGWRRKFLHATSDCDARSELFNPRLYQIHNGAGGQQSSVVGRDGVGSNQMTSVRSTILPRVSPCSLSRCASAACKSGNSVRRAVELFLHRSAQQCPIAAKRSVRRSDERGFYPRVFGRRRPNGVRPRIESRRGRLTLKC